MHVRCTGRSKNTASKDDLCFKCQTTIEFIALNKVSKCILRTCVQALLYHVFVKRSANGLTSTFGRTASELEPSPVKKSMGISEGSHLPNAKPPKYSLFFEVIRGYMIYIING